MEKLNGDKISKCRDFEEVGNTKEFQKENFKGDESDILNENDPYEVFIKIGKGYSIDINISKASDFNENKQIYRKLIRLTHPDLNILITPEITKKLNEAYEKIQDLK